MNKKIKSLIVAISLVGSFSVSLAETKIAIINPMDVFQNTDSGSLSVKKVENKLKPESSQIEKERSEIISQIKSLSESDDTITKSALDEKRSEIQKQQKALSEKMKSLEKKTNDAKQKISKQFQAQVEKAVDEISKEKGYNLVINSQSALYVNGVDDITEQVIELMNKE